MDKNAAPNRYQLKNGYSFLFEYGGFKIVNQHGVVMYDSDGFWDERIIERFIADMDIPVPSGSDEAAFSDEDDALLMSAAENLRSADKTNERVDAAFRIAFKLDEYRKRMASRHRQPAAQPVSKTAEDLAQACQSHNELLDADELKHIAEIIQDALTAAEIRAGEKVREAAVKTEGRYGDTVRDNIRALDVAAIVKGDK